MGKLLNEVHDVVLAWYCSGDEIKKDVIGEYLTYWE
jgi:hypothetical protein